MLHGDIHPGNCMVGDDGRIVILDFGHSRSIGDAASEVDIARAGIPQFYDPQMAQALRAGALAPAASPASEQYAIAALAYLLLTGLHPIDSPAVQDELLRRIAERPPLSFAARGVTSWPAMEGVLRRALAPQPEDRFSDLTKMAQAFAAAGSAPGTTQRPASLSSGACEPAFKACLASVRRLAPEPRFRRDRAWFALRAAVALEDAELLAVAGCLAARAGSDPQACMVAAKLAQAHSDVRAEGRAIAIFLDKARGLAEGMATLRALLAAARILEAGSSRCTEATALAAWATQRLRRLCRVPRRGANPTSTTDTAIVLAALALAKTGRVEAMPAL